MANFGSELTSVPQVGNALTPKAGIADPTANIAITGAGKAATDFIVGSELGEARARTTEAVEEEIGLTKLALDEIGGESTIDATRAPQSINDFRASVSRHSQIIARGPGTIAERAKIRVQDELRRRVANQPWLANEFRRVAQEVLSDHSGVIDLLEVTERAIKSQAGTDPYAARRGRLQSLLEETGMVPQVGDTTVSVGDMDIDMLRYWEAQALKANRAMVLLEEDRASASEQRAATAESRAQAGESREATTFADTQYLRDKDRRFIGYGTILLSQYGAEISQFAKQVSDAIRSGDPVAGNLEAVVTSSLAEIEGRFNQELNKFEISADKKAAVREQFAAQKRAIETLLRGDASQVAQNSRAIQDFETRTGLELWDVAPQLSRLREQLGDIAFAEGIRMLALGSPPFRELLARSFQGLVPDPVKEQAKVDTDNSVSALTGERTDINAVPESSRNSVLKTMKDVSVEVSKAGTLLNKNLDEPGVAGAFSNSLSTLASQLVAGNMTDLTLVDISTKILNGDNFVANMERVRVADEAAWARASEAAKVLSLHTFSVARDRLETRILLNPELQLEFDIANMQVTLTGGGHADAVKAMNDALKVTKYLYQDAENLDQIIESLLTGGR